MMPIQKNRGNVGIVPVITFVENLKKNILKKWFGLSV